jgi:hypothetical protein
MLWRCGKAYSLDLRERVLASADAGVPGRAGRQTVCRQRVLCVEGLEPPADNR